MKLQKAEKFLFFTSPDLWYSIIIAQADQYTSTWLSKSVSSINLNFFFSKMEMVKLPLHKIFGRIKCTVSLKHSVCAKYAYVVLAPHVPGFLPQHPHLEFRVLALISCYLPALQPHTGSRWSSPEFCSWCPLATAPGPAGFSPAGPDFLSPVSAPIAGTISILRVSCPCYFLRWSIYQLACVAEPVYPFPTTPSALVLAPSYQPLCLG